MDQPDIFEVELQDVYNYRFSYGGQSSYFRGLERRELTASECKKCGFTWCPPRPVCSHCYEETGPLKLSGEGGVLVILSLSVMPEQFKNLQGTVYSALIRPDGTDTCIKAFVVSGRNDVVKGARVRAEYFPTIKTIADFYFVPI